MSYALHHHPKPSYHLPHGIEYPDTHHAKFVQVLAMSIWLATGFLIELLAVRFMIAFLGADPANAFFQFIYTSSQPFIEPFANIFGDLVQLGPNRFEAYTLIAIAAYAFIGYGLSKTIDWLHKE